MILEELKKCLKKAKNGKTIFDIILYGSSVKGAENPRDIDIAVLFLEGSLKERLSKTFELKKLISSKYKLDMKTILLQELFKPEFFARSGMFLEGISIFDTVPLAEKIGFKGEVLFLYNLKDKNHNEKVKFNYILGGRNSEGVIKMLEGQHISPGSIKIPIKNEIEFENILKMHKITYVKKRILLEI